MKHIRNRSPLIKAAIPGLLASGFITCGIFAAPSPAPSPAASSPAAQETGSRPVLTGSIGDTGPSMPENLMGLTGSGPVTDPNIVGRVGSTDVSVEEMRAIVHGLDPVEQEALASNPALLKRVVFSLLAEKVLLKEIIAKQWDKQPNVQEHLERVRRSTLADMYLKTVSEPPANYPGADELHAAYESRKNTFIVPHQFQIAQIFIALPSGADHAAIDKARGKLEAVIKNLNQPNADFAAIAHAQSDDAKSAAQGGSMGWVSDKAMPVPIRVHAINLPRNTISEPIRLDDGWHIIKVSDFKEMGPLSFDDVKEDLARKLRSEKLQANMQSYLNGLMQATPVTINDKALANLIPKPQK